MVTIGEKIQYLRKSRGMSQTEFGKIFEVERSTVSSWEIGRRTPDISTLSEIANYCGVSISFFQEKSSNIVKESLLPYGIKLLATEDDNRFSIQITDKPTKIDREFTELINQIAQLTEEEKAKLIPTLKVTLEVQKTIMDKEKQDYFHKK